MKKQLSVLFIVGLLVSCGLRTPTYTLTTTVSPSEGGSITPLSGKYSEGETLTIQSTPSEGWKFVRWEGDLSNITANSVNITMTRDLIVIGIFEGSTFFLDSNGITIKCPNSEVGEKGMVNGIEYESVDRDLLELRRDQGSDLTRVCVSLVTDMSNMFKNTTFNQPIGNWDVSGVTDMWQMFWESQFNQPIGDWDVSKVTDMGGMFLRSPFNQPIGNWDVSSVTNMYWMFLRSPFNQPIGDWDVSKVSNMGGMFQNSQFNQPIGDWDVSKVTDMGSMFMGAQFNHPIGDWDVSKVTDMRLMFDLSQFNHPINRWCVNNIPSEPFLFSDGPPLNALIPENKPIWGTCPSN